MRLGANARYLRSGGEGGLDGSRLAIYRYTKPFLANAPLCVACVRVCAMHPYLFIRTLRISASCLSFLAFVFHVFSSFFLLFFFFFFLYALVEDLCMCTSRECVPPLLRLIRVLCKDRLAIAIRSLKDRCVTVVSLTHVFV